jgi:hypothetical protein
LSAWVCGESAGRPSAMSNAINVLYRFFMS